MRIVLALLATTLFCTSCRTEAQTRATHSDSAAERRYDEIFSAGTTPQAPGLAAMIRKNGRTVYAKGFGVSDVRTKPRINLETNFRLASFTKQFTAMAVVLLAHDRKLRFDETLPEIFPEFPAYGKQITIRNLLNHTGGLPDYEDLMNAAEKANRHQLWSGGHQIQDAEVLALLEKESEGKFAPGTNWAYSNSGYVVLGLIVAKISGQPFGDFLRQRIFAPLGMAHTIVYQEGKNDVTDRAYGYSVEDGAFQETDQSATSATLGDGGIYSNLDDLAKWDDALRKHTFLSPAEMMPALVPATLNNGSLTFWPADSNGDNLHPGKPVAYGFGWFLDPYEGHTRMWHAGSTSGFRTVIERFTSDKLTIVILANRTDLDPESLALKAADLLLAAPEPTN